MSGILVVAEHRRGEIGEVTFELISCALELQEQGAGDVRVAVIGAGAEQLAAGCQVDGIHEVIGIETSSAEFEPHLTQSILEELLGELKPAAVLAGQTVDACGFAPALAARRQLGFASNVLHADWREGALRASRGVYGDRLVADLVFDRPITVLMVRSGAYPAAAAGQATVRLTRTEGEAITTHHGFKEVQTDGVDITQSEFLLSIGRGIGEEENVERFAQLAGALGATLSSSRPLVDAGWVPSARQVGQSGRTVKPKVYLALGISGAAQHLAGIRDAENVIAVNSDPEAPIFGVARYGAVLDVLDLADELEGRV
jgi:electron transfer flavoprotein alpha subunit